VTGVQTCALPIFAGQTDVGDVVAVVNYALRTSMAISMFTFITLGFSRAKASADRIDEVLEVEVDLFDHDHAHKSKPITEGSISFDRVSFSYPNVNIPILNDISFTVKSRENLAIIGATGSGKTTMFQLIPRLYDVTSGEIYIDEQPISDYTLKSCAVALDIYHKIHYYLADQSMKILLGVKNRQRKTTY